MPPCNCTKCGCSVAQNGVVFVQTETGIVGAEFLPSTRIGWRDNVVDGQGSSAEPFSVSFVDSVEYRPWAAEMKQISPVSGDFTASSMQYNQNGLFVWSAGFPEEINLTQTGVLLGAYVSVTSGAAVDVSMELAVGFFSYDNGMVSVASHSVGAVISPILNAVGYLSPLRTFPVVSSGLTATVNLSLVSSVAVTVNEVRVWGITV